MSPIEGSWVTTWTPHPRVQKLTTDLRWLLHWGRCFLCLLTSGRRGFCRTLPGRVGSWMGNRLKGLVQTSIMLRRTNLSWLILGVTMTLQAIQRLRSRALASAMRLSFGPWWSPVWGLLLSRRRMALRFTGTTHLVFSISARRMAGSFFVAGQFLRDTPSSQVT